MSTMRRRIVQLVKAADRHLILHADGSLSQIEAELFNISLPPPAGPSMPALDAEMAPPPPQQRPVDRKGKAPVRTAPRPQPIKPVVAFQRPPPPINLASHPSTLVSPTYSSWIPVDSSGFHCIPLEYTYV